VCIVVVLLCVSLYYVYLLYYAGIAAFYSVQLFNTSGILHTDIRLAPYVAVNREVCGT